MSPQIKEITCTSCGAPLHLANPASRTARCGQCGAQLDLTKPEFEVLGKFHRRSLPRGIRVGLPFTWDGTEYTLRGVIGYAEKGYSWYEFMLLSEAGNVLWLELDENKWTLFKPFRPNQPVDPSGLTSNLKIDGENHLVMDRGTMRVTYIEGELTWKLKKDDEMRWINATDVGAEWTEDDVEFFHRETLTDSKVVAAFGNRIRSAPLSTRESMAGTPGGSLQGVSVGTIVVILIVIVFIFIALSSATSGSGGGGGGFYYGGHSSRSSSFGGGFSGGK